MPSPNYPVLCCPLLYRVAPVFVQVCPPLGWSPLSYFLFGLQVVTLEVHRWSLRRLICPAHDHFICLTVLIISMTFVLSLTQMLVSLSLYVMLSILLSILICAAASLFCACLFGQCPGLCIICHSWQHTGVVHLSLQADGNVAFEDGPMIATRNGLTRGPPCRHICN